MRSRNGRRRLCGVAVATATMAICGAAAADGPPSGANEVSDVGGVSGPLSAGESMATVEAGDDLGDVTSALQTPLRADAGADQRAAAARNVFQTLGDAVHLSSTPPPAMSAHGWWRRISGPATQARVTVQIQQHWGGWVSVGSPGVATVRSGGGAGNRATARVGCHQYAGRTYTYRSIVDVDIIGYNDTPEKLYTPARETNCSVLGRDR
jgi:hypothetical protein